MRFFLPILIFIIIVFRFPFYILGEIGGFFKWIDNLFVLLLSKLVK